MKLSKIKHQTGASMVELIFVMPLFLCLVGGIIEMGYVYRTKATLNAATFDAVRQGAVTNLSKDRMRSTLAAGMMPLYTFGKVDAAGLTQALARSVVVERTISLVANAASLDTVDIISPNKAVFDAFVQDVPMLEGQRVRLTKAIPNDNLMYRPTSLQSVSVGGESVQLNIQDANLIKIKTLWCHRLKIPGLRDIAKKLVLDSPLFTLTAEQALCNQVGELGGPTNGVYVAMTAQAIARAQSPIYSTDLK
jgi:hypothetical protein